MTWKSQVCLRTSGQCGSFRLIVIRGLLLKLGPSWAGRSNANAGQAATHELSRRLLGNEELPQHVRVQVGKACVASRCLHQAGTRDALEGPQLQRLKVAWCKTLAHDCRDPPAVAPRSEMEVQRCGAEGAASRQLGGRACGYEASLRSEGCQVGTSPYVLTMLQSGAAATWRSAVCSRPSSTSLGPCARCRCVGRNS